MIRYPTPYQPDKENKMDAVQVAIAIVAGLEALGLLALAIKARKEQP